MIQEESRRQRYRRKVLFARKLRQRMTRAEEMLWAYLRDRRFAGLKFRRQVPMGWFVADFLCRERRLIIEVDGDTHSEAKEYDAQRDSEIREHGYCVLRFRNEQVLKNLKDVLRVILESAGSLTMQ